MLFLTACLAPGYECYALCSDIEIDQAEQYVLELSGRGAFQAAVPVSPRKTRRLESRRCRPEACSTRTPGVEGLRAIVLSTC